MQSEAKLSEPVRCVVCHTVYEQPQEPPKHQTEPSCPSCGGTVWLAAWIPVEETAAAVLG